MERDIRRAGSTKLHGCCLDWRSLQIPLPVPFFEVLSKAWVPNLAGERETRGALGPGAVPNKMARHPYSPALMS